MTRVFSREWRVSAFIPKSRSTPSPMSLSGTTLPASRSVSRGKSRVASVPALRPNVSREVEAHLGSAKNLGGPSLVLAIFFASERVMRPSSFRSPALTVKCAFLASLRLMWPSLLVSALTGVLGIFVSGGGGGAGRCVERVETHTRFLAERSVARFFRARISTRPVPVDRLLKTQRPSLALAPCTGAWFGVWRGPSAGSRRSRRRGGRRERARRGPRRPRREARPRLRARFGSPIARRRSATAVGVSPRRGFFGPMRRPRRRALRSGARPRASACTWARTGTSTARCVS